MRTLLTGNLVKLTSIGECDAKIINEWFNDIEFLRNYDMAAALPKNHKELQANLDNFFNTSERYIFAIKLLENNEIVGIIGFDDIIWSSSVATFFIGIGDKGQTGKGIGSEAMRLLLDFGFNELNFHRIQLNVIAYNEPAIKLYERQGFTREGTYREFIHRDGNRYDLYLYGLLRNEWK